MEYFLYGPSIGPSSDWSLDAPVMGLNGSSQISGGFLFVFLNGWTFDHPLGLRVMGHLGVPDSTTIFNTSFTP